MSFRRLVGKENPWRPPFCRDAAQDMRATVQMSSRAIAA